MDSLIKDSFQSSLMKMINTTQINKNVIISPLSIYLILSICSNGAVDDTLSQMLKTLSPKSKDLAQLNKECYKLLSTFSKSDSIKVANAIFSKLPIMKKFKENVKQFSCSIDNLSSVSQINSWCSEHTNKKITKIVDSIDGMNILLINAVYFLCSWKKKFIKMYTREGNFTKSDSTIIKCQMMHYEDEKILYSENDEYQIIQLDYSEKKLNAVIILPKTNIDTFISSLDQSKLTQMIKGMRKNKVSLTMPKFELEFEICVESFLPKMGMKDAFMSEKANFSNMIEKGNFSIDRVTHKTYIRVDEDGTEAAAVTAVGASCSGMGDTTCYMRVTHPFLFIIRHSDFDEHYLFISKIEHV